MVTLINFLSGRGESKEVIDLLSMHKRASDRRTDIVGMQDEIDTLKQETERLERLMLNVVNVTEDMLWAKDIDGRFIFTNKSIRDDLLISDSLKDSLGKTDSFFADRQRTLGHEYTFGKICMASDQICIDKNRGRTRETAIPLRFRESGMVNGEDIKLQVVKSCIWSDDGTEIIGTCGTARDVTDEFNHLQAIKLMWTEARGSDVCPGEGIDCQHATDALGEFLHLWDFPEEEGSEIQ